MALAVAVVSKCFCGATNVGVDALRVLEVQLTECLSSQAVLCYPATNICSSVGVSMKQ